MSSASAASRLPKYRRHKPSGQAVVTLSCKDFYLGPWNTKASRTEYDRLIGEWLAAGRCVPKAKDVTVAELAKAYYTFANGFYRNKDGDLTGSFNRIRVAVRTLRTAYGLKLATEFGPLALQAIQKRLATSGRCRRYVDSQTGRLTGTPPAAGTMTVAIEASTQFNRKASQRFKLRVE